MDVSGALGSKLVYTVECGKGEVSEASELYKMWNAEHWNGSYRYQSLKHMVPLMYILKQNIHIFLGVCDTEKSFCVIKRKFMHPEKQDIIRTEQPHVFILMFQTQT